MQGGAGLDRLTLLNSGSVAAAALGGMTGVETIALSATGNALTLTDAVVAANKSATNVLTVLGGAGNDSVDGGAIANALNGLDVTAGAGVDTLKGGAGADVFRINAVDLAAADVIQGGTGVDTLVLGGAGAVTAAALAGVSGIESLFLGTGSVTLNDAVMNANAATLSVTGTAGNDTLDASAVTLRGVSVTARAGNDLLKGGGGADDFRFNAADLNASDTVQGGAGSDRLTLLATGAVAAASLANVTGVETIALSAAGNALTLTDAVVAANKSTANVLTVIGGAGNDVVNGAGLTSTVNALNISIGSGNDTAFGGAGADTIQAATTEISNLDSINGGLGSQLDTLAFTTAGTVDFTVTTKVTNFERVTLANGTNSLTLSDAFVDSALSVTVTVTGGTGADTIDVQNLSSGRTVVINTGLGADAVLIGSSSAGVSGDLGGGADTLTVDASVLPTTFAAGTEIDTLNITYDYYYYGAVTMDAGLTGFEVVNLDTGGVYYYSNDFTANNTAGLTVNVIGSEAAGFTIQLGSGGQRANGGVGNDTIDGGAGADTINGGAGDDLIGYTLGDQLSGGVANAESDTLYTAIGGVFNLGNAADQSSGDTSVVTSFENISAQDSGVAISVTGSNGANDFYGSDANDTLDGAQGLDVIQGRGGADRISYWGTEQSLSGYLTSYGLYYLEGDTLVLRAAATVDLVAADQTVGDAVAVDGFDNVDASDVGTGVNLSGNDYANQITGGSSTDNLYGLAGSDTIDGRVGADSTDAGDGDDVVVYDAADALMDGGGDVDTLRIGAGTGTIAGNLNNGDQTAGDAGLTVNFESVDASGRVGAITFTGRDDASSTLLGGLGNDTLTAGQYGAYLDGGAGADRMIGGIGYDTIHVETGDIVAGESIQGGDSSDQLNVDGVVNISGITVTGIEQFVLGAGASLTMSGAQVAQLSSVTFGSDDEAVETLTINLAVNGSVNLNVVAFPGYDDNDAYTINGAAGNETIIDVGAVVNAGAGNDTIASGGGNPRSVVNGDAGNDVIDYQANNGTLDGGADSDTLTANFYPGIDLAEIDLSNATDQSIGDSTIVRNFENIDFTEDYAVLKATGSTGANRIVGGFYGDTIVGGAGVDTLDGGSGSDFITYDGTDASAAGGDGDTDTLVVVGAATIDLGAADQSIGDTSVVTGFESVDASDAIVGVNITGSDDYYGASLIGGSGADTIAAGDQFAYIEGGAGADVLSSGDGGAELDIGVGAFVAGESITGGTNTDYVYTEGAVNFSAGSLTGVEYLYVSAGGAITLSGDQVSVLYSIQSQGDNETIETLTVNVGTSLTADLSGLNLSWGEEDLITVNGTAGNDTIATAFRDGVTYSTGGGDDLVDVYGMNNYANITLDGGAGSSDTIFCGAGGNFETTIVNLASTTDQITTDADANVTRGFENIDFSGMNESFDVTGSIGANLLVTSYYNDTIVGGDGADTLDGNSGFDLLTGGAGADTFRFSARDNDVNTIADFVSGSDKIAFNSALFNVDGPAVNAQVSDNTGNASLVGVDLLRYTGSALDSASDVYTLLQNNATGSNTSGIFVLGFNTANELVLFHDGDATGYDYDAVEVANFGVRAINSIALTDFQLI